MSYFKAYTTYANNFDNALQTIAQCKQDPIFAEFLEVCLFGNGGFLGKAKNQSSLPFAVLCCKQARVREDVVGRPLDHTDSTHSTVWLASCSVMHVSHLYKHGAPQIHYVAARSVKAHEHVASRLCSAGQMCCADRGDCGARQQL